MVVVDFDGNFLAIIVGWEGSAHDNLILRKSVEEGVVVPSNKYYLVDGGYANTRHFLSLYRGRPYHFASFDERTRTRNLYECPKDMFNH
jgi:DDE superfamily endonuclease